MSETIKPYNQDGTSKRVEVEQMFDDIAPRYDLLNHLLTFGIDIHWRNGSIKLLQQYKPQIVVDIATGTGDFAAAAAKLKPKQIIGIDISKEMLKIGSKKMKKLGLEKLVEMRQGDSEDLDLEDNSVDAITVGFGVRNFENLKKGLSEIHRVLRPGGAVVILEPAFPSAFPMKQLSTLYFKYITPLVGGTISGSKEAYAYLPASVKAFPHGEAFTAICKEVGFKKAEFKSLTLGVCARYLLEK